MQYDLRFSPVVPRTTSCKCCGNESHLFGVVDISKNCEEIRGLCLELSGIPIYYHRCLRCGFIFTVAFDSFSPEDFACHIYNAEYERFDPDYADVRPRLNAQWLTTQLGPCKPSRILDYGAGKGLLADRLRKSGFTNVESHDPFVPEYSSRPDGKFDCIVCFEVMEHSPHPIQTMNDMVSFLANPGVIMFSTLVQPDTIEQEGVKWWYIAPRNGHVSIYSTASLHILSAQCGLQYGHFKSGFHVVCNTAPEFFDRLIRAQKEKPTEGKRPDGKANA